MMFKSIAIAALVAGTSATDYFTLVTKSSNINEPITWQGNGFTSGGGGSVMTFSLEGASGYLSAASVKGVGEVGYLHIAQDQINYERINKEASNGFKFVDGKLYWNAVQFYACPYSASGNVIVAEWDYGCSKVDLVPVKADAPPSSSSSTTSPVSQIYSPSLSSSTSPVSQIYSPKTTTPVSQIYSPNTTTPVSQIHTQILTPTRTGYSNITTTTHTTHTTVSITACAANGINCSARVTVIPVVVTTTIGPGTTTKPNPNPKPSDNSTTVSPTPSPSANISKSSSSHAGAVKLVSGAGALFAIIAAFLL